MTASTLPSQGAAQAGGIVFERPQQVRFAHCDPAGIVFFPQYLVMTNGLVEDWFNEGLQIDYGAFVTTRRLGLPIVKLDCEFVAPSRIGDTLTLSLSVLAAGRSSLRLSISGSAHQQLRFRTEQILVSTSLDTHRSIPLPSDVLAGLQRYLPQAAQPRN
ncbi:acyl-CoA thioesterase [Mycetohabitans sp. B46]|uniref:acyl-CoA thioesterase n=1 Tax=Mycetohabitans sp. B46 TaxID=2772536 RepID=UPI00307D38A8